MLIYKNKLNEIKKNTKNIKIKILDKNNENNILNLEENIHKLNYDKSVIDYFIHMFFYNKKNTIFKSDLEKLYGSKILIPITLEFNRFHKASYKTESNKNNARSNIINDRIELIKRRY